MLLPILLVAAVVGGFAYAERKLSKKKGGKEPMTDNAPSTSSPNRKEEFLPDGTRKRVSSGDVSASWNKYTSRIPSNYATGTAKHESSFTINERDTEPSGFQSWGIFQLSKEEAKDAGYPDADLLSLDDSSKVFAKISEDRLDKILKAANLSTPTPDVWAYLAIAHNQGIGAALKTIGTYGLDWGSYKSRNPGIKGIASYGDDVIKGA